MHEILGVFFMKDWIGWVRLDSQDDDYDDGYGYDFARLDMSNVDWIAFKRWGFSFSSGLWFGSLMNPHTLL